LDVYRNENQKFKLQYITKSFLSAGYSVRAWAWRGFWHRLMNIAA
jgi:hypothetical protein